jgi:hypothetical protein
MGRTLECDECVIVGVLGNGLEVVQEHDLPRTRRRVSRLGARGVMVRGLVAITMKTASRTMMTPFLSARITLALMRIIITTITLVTAADLGVVVGE